MRSIILREGKYELAEIAVPVPERGELLVKVSYAGVNRADLYQKQGKYPQPQGGIPGLEVSGEVAACGEGVTAFAPGDKVCALLSEGAFAEYVVAPAGQVLPVPEGLTPEEAAALPEACFTAWVSLVWQAKLAAGEHVLIHGGASGIGHLAIQIARTLGAQVFATAGTKEKCDACTAAGAKAILHTGEDFVRAVKTATQGRGVDVILDMVGGDYFARNLDALAPGGRLAIIAFIKGPRVEANLSPILLKHLSVTGSTLRARSAQQKAEIAKEIRARLWPQAGKAGCIKPMIAGVFSLDEAEKALGFMEKGLNIGKILLKV